MDESIQQNKCIDYGIEKHIGVWGGHIYSDNAPSTLKASKRKEFRALLRAARAGEFKHVLVYRYDRIARNLEELLTVVDTLDKLGIKVHSVTEPFPDSQKIDGKFLSTILTAMPAFMEKRGCGGRCNH